MAVQKNAIELSQEYPMAAKVVQDSFYVDDCLTGVDDMETTVILHQQLQDHFD